MKKLVTRSTCSVVRPGTAATIASDILSKWELTEANAGPMLGSSSSAIAGGVEHSGLGCIVTVGVAVGEVDTADIIAFRDFLKGDPINVDSDEVNDSEFDRVEDWLEASDEGDLSRNVS